MPNKRLDNALQSSVEKMKRERERELKYTTFEPSLASPTNELKK
jgi:hypothetical protein